MNRQDLSRRRAAFLHRVGDLPLGLLLVFGIKQAWAALFGGLMIGAMLFTTYIDLPWISQYDWLFLFAIAIQGFMLAAKLEKPHEVLTIVAFHLVGLGMELFKTSGAIGSWSYPGDSFFHLGNVPLFSGFMYAAVGSYIARSWRVFGLRFAPYPKRIYTVMLAVAIYMNFFTHHYIWDFRYLLFVVILLLFGRTMVSFTLLKRVRRMPLVVGFFLIASVIWLAENVGTFTSTWLYADQLDGWHMVSFQKIGAWLLLMVISFIMVDIMHATRARLQAKPQSFVEP